MLPPPVRGKEERPAAIPRPSAPVDGHGPGVGLKCGGCRRPRSQAPALQSCDAAGAAVNQRPPLAGADAKPNFFDEFRYILLAEPKARDQAMAPSKMMQQQQDDANPNCQRRRALPSSPFLLNCCAAMHSAMAMKTNNEQQQKQEAGFCCHGEGHVPSGIDKFCHGCDRVHVPEQGQGAQDQPVCKHVHPGSATAVNGRTKKSSSQVSPPLSCADNTPSPLDKFYYILLSKWKDQDQAATDTPPLFRSSISLARFPPLGGLNVERKRKQTNHQARREHHCADKMRKTARPTAAEKPKKKSVSQRKKHKKITAPVLTTAEKRLDMYRCLPPDHLVTPRRTPYSLLQGNMLLILGGSSSYAGCSTIRERNR